MSAQRSLFSSLGLVLWLAAPAAQAAGSVSVTFVEPERFADVRDARHDASDNLRVLAAHIASAAGRHLGEGQTLSVEVLDVDLAGELRPSRVWSQDVRVLQGGADWPRITLRTTLEAAGRASRSGEHTLRDLAYLQRPAGVRAGGALVHEKRMLDEWFQAHLAPRSAP